MKKIITIVAAGLLVLLAACGTGKSSVKQVALNGDFAKDDYQRIVAAQNQVGFDLLPNVKPNKHGNIFVSPTSLFMALSMVYNGADGVTKEEIAAALRAQGIEADQLNKASASLMTKLIDDSKDNQLHIANSIWINKRFHFQDHFSKSNTDYFNANIKEIEPKDSGTLKMINDWVKDQTNGKIKEMVQGPLDDGLVTILINAIYFKGSWEYEFNKKLTEERPFQREDGTTKDVPLMTLKEELRYQENEDFQAVVLPYVDGKMSMTVFLPKDLTQFEKMLTVENWEKWNMEFHRSEGTLLLPKFKMEYEVILNETLQKLGMKAAFTKDANFSMMIKENDPILITQVKQKSYLDVNEQGTEAAAATSVEMKTTAAPANGPFHMEVNRPFFITITNEETGAILFMGKIANL